jgi:hypothetical protein
VYQFEVNYKGVRDEQSVVLERVMLLHPYRTFRIEDELDMSTGAEVMLRLRIGMISKHLSPLRVDKSRPLTFQSQYFCYSRVLGNLVQ